MRWLTVWWSDDLHTALVSANHIVCSQPEPPVLAAEVVSARHVPTPCSVTLTDPLAPPFILSPPLAVPESVLNPSVILPESNPALIKTRREPLVLS